MSASMLILVAFIIANIPWFTERLFFAFPLENGKQVWHRLLEIVVFYFVSLFIAIWAETQYSGDVHVQEWEFFATTFCVFLVLATPGFIYRYQWLSASGK